MKTDSCRLLIVGNLRHEIPGYSTPESPSHCSGGDRFHGNRYLASNVVKMANDSFWPTSWRLVDQLGVVLKFEN